MTANMIPPYKLSFLSNLCFKVKESYNWLHLDRYPINSLYIAGSVLAVPRHTRLLLFPQKNSPVMLGETHKRIAVIKGKLRWRSFRSEMSEYYILKQNIHNVWIWCFTSYLNFFLYIAFWENRTAVVTLRDHERSLPCVFAFSPYTSRPIIRNLILECMCRNTIFWFKPCVYTFDIFFRC